MSDITNKPDGSTKKHPTLSSVLGARKSQQSMRKTVARLKIVKNEENQLQEFLKTRMDVKYEPITSIIEIERKDISNNEPIEVGSHYRPLSLPTRFTTHLFNKPPYSPPSPFTTPFTSSPPYLHPPPPLLHSQPLLLITQLP